MSDDEQEKLWVELCRLWPNKYQDGELSDWSERTAKYPLREVLAALSRHKGASKFAPKVSEILAALKGKELRPDDDGRGRSLAQIRRAEWQDAGHAVAGMHDWEIVLRNYRGHWRRYARDADQRRAQIVAGAAERGVDPDLAAAWHDQQAAGARTMNLTHCFGSLVAHGMAADDARRAAEVICWDGPMFARGVADVLANTERVTAA